jgi:N-acyl-D-amino-acid deacylase
VYRLLILLFALGTSHAHSQNSYDIIISNGRVVDGSGNPWYEADIAIIGEHIVRIGDLCPRQTVISTVDTRANLLYWFNWYMII